MHGLIQWPAVQAHLPAFAAQSSLAEPIDGQWINDVLLDQHALTQGCFRIARQDRHTGLKYGRPAVEFFSDKVHRDAVLGFARFQYPPMRMQA